MLPLMSSTLSVIFSPFAASDRRSSAPKSTSGARMPSNPFRMPSRGETTPVTTGPMMSVTTDRGSDAPVQALTTLSCAWAVVGKDTVPKGSRRAAV